jgi:hypothetical protein
MIKQSEVPAPGAVKVLENYIAAHAAAKAAAVRVELLKPVFFGACDSIAAGGDQISISGALIYRITRTRWDYTTSAAIVTLEKALELAKAQFEQDNAPAGVQYSWAVKGGAK